MGANFSRVEVRKYLKLIFSPDAENFNLGLELFKNNSELQNKTSYILKGIRRVRKHTMIRRETEFSKIYEKFVRYIKEFEHQNGRRPNDSELERVFPEYYKWYNLSVKYNLIFSNVFEAIHNFYAYQL